MTKIIYDGEEIKIDDTLEKGESEFDLLDSENLDDTIEIPIIGEQSNE